MKSPLLTLPLLICASTAQAALVTDFDPASEFTDLFRFTFNSGNANTTAAGGIVSSVLTSGVGSSETLVYDETPVDATEKTTFTGDMIFSFDVRGAQALSSFGILIINPANEAGSVHTLALFSLDFEGTTDRVRLNTGSPINTALIGTDVASSIIVGNSGINAGGAAFTTVTLRYSQGPNNAAVMNLTGGNISTGDITLAAGSYLPSYEVGVRLYDAGAGTGGVDMDNFTASPIPEPTVGFLAAAGLGLLVNRRRR